MKKTLKRTAALMLSALLLIGAVPAAGLQAVADFLSVRASAETYSGECGAGCGNVTWALDTETGVLSVAGTGAMQDYTRYYSGGSLFTTAPWYSYGSSIRTVTIGSGVTYIGETAFAHLSMTSREPIYGALERRHCADGQRSERNACDADV